MNHHDHAPHLSGEDIAFFVNVDALDRECLIRKEALQQLSGIKADEVSQFSPLEVFHAYEGKIKGVARRLVAAGVSGTPLVLTPETFSSPPRTS
ncbi:DUF1488 family protein [Noviherbaspirillum humi]|uniref:DUF1488 family protein n=1 Tax=Noviherbaspirillum humi TaxID=1688639 RepID=UPI001595EC16|nr:DUF1488 family protein [Noviherbaspirillum humi]